MKILLLGEFSGVHLNLKSGLVKLGHEVVIASKGDGFKKMDSDISIYTRGSLTNKYKGSFMELSSQLTNMKHLKNFDIVQPTTFEFFHNRLDSILFEKVIKSNDKSVMLNTSCTTPYNDFVKTLDYSACSDCMKFDLKQDHCVLKDHRYQKIEGSRYNLFDAFASTHYEYFEAFNNSALKDKNHFIPLPFNSENCEPHFEPVRDKIVVYYGELRKGFKGGLYIEQALEKLKASKYANEFEIIHTNRLSFEEYQKILKKSHVLLDQSSSYSYAMNALYGLANGKIVFTGAEQAALDIMNIPKDENPMMNILPDAEDIYTKLVSLLENKNNLSTRSEMGIEFVKKYHSIEKISKSYETLYKSLL